MKDVSTIGANAAMCFLLYCCAPQEVGEHFAKIQKGYQEEMLK